MIFFAHFIFLKSYWNYLRIDTPPAFFVLLIEDPFFLVDQFEEGLFN